MSSSKPCLASMPLAFMMFQTSGLNTGSVRLDTLMTGFCCACAGAVAAIAATNAAANAASPRRDIVDMVLDTIVDMILDMDNSPCGLARDLEVSHGAKRARLYSAFISMQRIVPVGR